MKHKTETIVIYYRSHLSELQKENIKQVNSLVSSQTLVCKLKLNHNIGCMFQRCFCEVSVTLPHLRTGLIRIARTENLFRPLCDGKTPIARRKVKRRRLYSFLLFSSSKPFLSIHRIIHIEAIFTINTLQLSFLVDNLPFVYELLVLERWLG